LRRKTLTLVAALLLVATSFQVALDRTPAGTKGGGGFPSAVSLTRFLGGIRQYLAYVYFIKADKLYHTYGNNQELIAYYILVTYLDPHYVDAYYVACGLINEAGKYREALELNLRGIASNPDAADLYASIAEFYVVEKRYQEAKDAYEKAVELGAKLLSKYTLLKFLAATYGVLGEEEKARQLFLEAVNYNRIRLSTQELEAEDVSVLVKMINGDCDFVLPDGYAGER